MQTKAITKKNLKKCELYFPDAEEMAQFWGNLSLENAERNV